MTRLSNHDAAFLYGETASGPMHSITVSVVEAGLAFETFREFFASRIDRVPRLRQRLAQVPLNLAHARWVDDPAFDLSHHLRRVSLPPETTMDDAIDHVIALCEPPLDRSRPLWNYWVAEQIEGRTLIVQQAHHVFLDGATALAIAVALSDDRPDVPLPPRSDTAWTPPPPPSPLELLQQALAENLQRTVERISTADAMFPDAARRGAEVLARLVTRPVKLAPWNAGFVGPKRTYARLAFQLDDLERVCGVLGGTLDDVVLAAVSEAAARYLESHGETVRGHYLRLMCPVNVHEPGTDPLQDGGGRVSAMFPMLPAWPLPLDQRLAVVRTETDRIRAEGEAEALDALMRSVPEPPPIAMFPGQWLGTAFDPTRLAALWPLPVPPPGSLDLTMPGFNLTVSQVPGLPWTQYVVGHRVSARFGTMMLGGTLGLGVAFTCHDGTLTFGLTAEPRLLPDVGRLQALLAEAVDELLQAAMRHDVPEPVARDMAADVGEAAHDKGARSARWEEPHVH